MENRIDDIDEEVYLAKWMAGEISDAELKQLISENDFASFQKIKAGITIFEQLEAPLDLTFQKIKEKIKSNAQTKPKAKILNLYSKIALAVAAAIIIFLSINIFFGDHYIIHQTGFGAQEVVILLDGSEVILNAKSELKYNKKTWNTNREVSLKGEAFFKVKKGSKFTVVTNHGKVVVLGTQFNVNSRSDFFEVICYSGKVKVVSKSKELMLLPNQSMRNISGEITEAKAVILDAVPTWIVGESSFKSVPLKQVILALENQFNIQIDSKNVDDAVIFTGSFDHKDLTIALASVFKTVQLKYSISNNKVTLSK
ncbi:FecR family protein [Pedobacter cryophilus]|uniref:DUF4974 domain-containing protein n=1 Tax=Pedobacter cryophilus TaxID=2571271 RepID=A0A4U1C6J2_9SPHI|nr:FecR family protein [Pedobacter cryophilus]TKC00935.1 DUF4974 domain-containing protein [Pedobacter cryophilus]